MGPKCARIPNYDGHHYVGTWVDTALEGLYNSTSATVDGPTDPSSGGVKCLQGSTRCAIECQWSAAPWRQR